MASIFQSLTSTRVLPACSPAWQGRRAAVVSAVFGDLSNNICVTHLGSRAEHGYLTNTQLQPAALTRPENDGVIVRVLAVSWSSSMHHSRALPLHLWTRLMPHLSLMLPLFSSFFTSGSLVAAFSLSSFTCTVQ